MPSKDPGRASSSDGITDNVASLLEAASRTIRRTVEEKAEGEGPKAMTVQRMIATNLRMRPILARRSIARHRAFGPVKRRQWDQSKLGPFPDRDSALDLASYPP